MWKRNTRIGTGDSRDTGKNAVVIIRRVAEEERSRVDHEGDKIAENTFMEVVSQGEQHPPTSPGKGAECLNKGPRRCLLCTTWCRGICVELLLGLD